MNREIKFRAWNIPNKLMYQNVQDGLLAKNEKGQLVLGVSLGKLSKDAGSVLMQFTGLVDKNGTEIFEQDILKTRFGNKICFSDLVDYHLWNIENSNAFLETEIIGNIYENPKLL